MTTKQHFWATLDTLQANGGDIALSKVKNQKCRRDNIPCEDMKKWFQRWGSGWALNTTRKGHPSQARINKRARDVQPADHQESKYFENKECCINFPLGAETKALDLVDGLSSTCGIAPPLSKIVMCENGDLEVHSPPRDANKMRNTWRPFYVRGKSVDHLSQEVYYHSEL